MVRVYVAEHCLGSQRAQRLVAQVRLCYPDAALEIVDITIPGTVIPPEIFATPIYTWNDHIIFLGNPSETALLDYIRRDYEYNGHRHQRN
ncbi:MAG: hypothetical protein HC876_02370 [Chloroflexaceae bacterium]|nr:hypothetical protein [Chloroflexaceae bacterium]NJO04460.1 hypothetical protein [Chloroflexaceae bacterium]